MRSGVTGIFAACALCACVSSAQTDAASRAAEIKAYRAAKVLSLKPERVSRLHGTFRYVQEERLVERFTTGVAGFRARLGGLGPGSGFATGIEYFRPYTFGRDGRFRTSAAGSPRGFYLLDMDASLARPAWKKFELSLIAGYQRSPKIDYYGPGRLSSPDIRTGYSLEDTGFGMRAAFRPKRRLSMGGSTGYLFFNVGPSREDGLASTEQIFSAGISGLSRQTSFLNSTAFLEFDGRTYEFGRPDGTRYLVSLSNYFDTRLRLHSFNRLDAAAARHFAFLNGQREIALVARTAITGLTGPGGVPFYLQPQLGGANDLRGFRARRFYGDNLVAATAEYRWEIVDNIDAAVFADAGQVFSRASELRLGNIEGAYGFGFRFRSGRVTAWRIDLGISHEGPQLWVTFDDVF